MSKVLHHARAMFQPATLNEESRTVDVVFATDTPVLRYSWAREELYHEVLDMNGADLSRAVKGLPVLDNHRSYGSVKDTVIGRAENIRKENNTYVATVRFSKRGNVQEMVTDIRDGILTDISFGYSIDEVERMEKMDGEKYRKVMVRKWTPTEVSFVSIPADPRAGVRSEGDGPDLLDMAERNNPDTPAGQSGVNSDDVMKREQIIALLEKRGVTVPADATDEQLTQMLERAMEPTPAPAPAPAATPNAGEDAVKAERQRVKEINAAVRAAGLGSNVAEDLIERGVSVDAARAEVLAKLAANQPTNEIGGQRSLNVGKEQKEKVRSAMTDALVLRANSSLEAGMKPEQVASAREFRGLTMVEMAARSLQENGVETRGMSRREIAELALGSVQRAYHTSSDFPLLLQDTFNRTLRAAYDMKPRTFQSWARRTTVPDFREISRVQLSGLVGDFDEVVESAEYKAGTFETAREKYRVAKYGKLVPVSWEMLVNDDLDAFSRTPMAIANKAYQKQSDLVYSVLINNPVMGDGVQLFNAASHFNHVSSGTALSETTLRNAITAMRKQKDPNGDFINVEPSFLIVGPENEFLAYKLTSTNYVPARQSDVSIPTITGLQVIVEPRITDHAFILAASPGQIDTVEYAFLDGEPEIYTEQKTGFDVDGLQIKARMIFGVKAIDWRGLYKNNGAAPTP
jgi:hypothetical protein